MVSGMKLRIVSWNIAHRDETWRYLLDTDGDIALLQEAKKPPADVARRLGVDPAPWRTAGGNRPWRAAIVRLSNRVELEWLQPKAVGEAEERGLIASRPGTLAAASVTPSIGEPFVVVSMYAPWEKPHGTTGSGWIFADGSAHKVISDLSVLIGQERGHRIIAAGDLNILYGHGEDGSAYWAARYLTVFKRLEALGLSFIGPQAPHGRVADPWPEELPSTSKNVPTYHTNRQTPSTATRQLDFVFASKGLGGRVRVKALNDVNQWGPSDHCRVLVEYQTEE